MLKLEELPEIVSGKMTAEFFGKSIWWLRRRRQRGIPIYIPNAEGKYPHRQVELIHDVESGVYTAEEAHRVLQSEHEAKRAQDAMSIAKAIAKAKKRGGRK
jgi:hypothetical protein